MNLNEEYSKFASKVKKESPEKMCSVYAMSWEAFQCGFLLGSATRDKEGKNRQATCRKSGHCSVEAYPECRHDMECYEYNI